MIGHINVEINTYDDHSFDTCQNYMTITSLLHKLVLVMGKNTVEAKAWLDKYYSGFASLRQMVEKYFAVFNCSLTNTNDVEGSGHQKEVVTKNNNIPLILRVF